MAPALGSGPRLHHWGAALPWRTPLGGNLPGLGALPCLPPPCGTNPGPCPASKARAP